MLYFYYKSFFLSLSKESHPFSIFNASWVLPSSRPKLTTSFARRLLVKPNLLKNQKPGLKRVSLQQHPTMYGHVLGTDTFHDIWWFQDPALWVSPKGSLDSSSSHPVKQMAEILCVDARVSGTVVFFLFFFARCGRRHPWFFMPLVMISSGFLRSIVHCRFCKTRRQGQLTGRAIKAEKIRCLRCLAT